MNSEPKLEMRAAIPYAAIQKEVFIPFGSKLGEMWGECAGWLTACGAAPTEPPFIRYLFVEMPRLLIEVGFTTASVLPGDERITTGELPAGTYAVMEYAGHYEGLMAATGYLLEWAEKNGVRWQKTDDPAGGEHWVSRLETYPTDPDKEPNPEKWITELAMLTLDKG